MLIPRELAKPFVKKSKQRKFALYLADDVYIFIDD